MNTPQTPEVRCDICHNPIWLNGSEWKHLHLRYLGNGRFVAADHAAVPEKKVAQ